MTRSQRAAFQRVRGPALDNARHSGLVTVTFARQSGQLARGRRLGQFPVAVDVGCATVGWIK